MDIIGKRNIFITLSVIIIIAGLISIGYHKGLKYGIDFAGGANVIVKYNEPVTIEKLNEIRELLSSN
ncbi:protein translocase subunit SecF, partial [Candidatus Dependentiae bacterium]|nr:protein translocase subunit SecF [Candidatus Dependentiae bacterium]